MITPIAPGVPPTTETGLLQLIAFVKDVAASEARLKELSEARDGHDAARDAAQAAIAEQIRVTAQNEADAAANKAAAKQLVRDQSQFRQERAESQARLMAGDKELEAQRQKLGKEVADWGEMRAGEESTLKARAAEHAKAEVELKDGQAKLASDIAETKALNDKVTDMKADLRRQIDEMAAIVQRRPS